ncbi:TauD/TfdA family dioxygenase [Asticcacaulis sp. SL142]|uniref:TauD/TfdA family dioxygenase n=1 Tax=Asticcacaulis sp. SL142 TaxID=2995155 RepID=UPI00226C7502|nr:TauD/TfdA family dioxygenase [Asticcacaulis sp. SL142]WAC49771.1 TauD/TfdA family dioxygenase [Asticcacaulis sp. SL142]
MIRKTDIDTIRISEQESLQILVNASGLTYPATGSYEPFLDGARGAMGTAYGPKTLADIRAMSGCGSGVLVIEGLPFDASVTRGLADPEVALANKPSDLSEVILAGTVKLIGEPYAILQEGRGLISHLSPKRSHLMTNTGLGAILELAEHIENSAARLLPGDRSPDGLALISVAKERDTSPGTIIADGRLALASRPEKSQAILRDPERFSIRFPERWRKDGFPELLPTAIVYGYGDDMTFVASLYGDMTVGNDAEAQAELDAFAQALHAVSVDLYLEPGRLALISNRAVFHGRRGFTPAFDADGLPYRFLQRLFWTSSVDRFGDWPRIRGRLIHPRP